MTTQGQFEFTKPRTWVPGEVALSSDLNQELNISAFELVYDKPSLMLSRASTQTISGTGVSTDIAWDTEVWDFYAMHGTGANASITIPVEGLWTFYGSVHWEADAAGGWRLVTLSVDGVEQEAVGSTVEAETSASQGAVTPFSVGIFLQRSDVVKLVVRYGGTGNPASLDVQEAHIVGVWESY